VYRSREAGLALSIRTASRQAYADYRTSRDKEELPTEVTTYAQYAAMGDQAQQARARTQRAFARALCAYNKGTTTRRVSRSTTDEPVAQGLMARQAPTGLSDDLPLAAQAGILDGYLDNGMRVTVVGDPGVSTVAVVHRFDVGAAHEPAAQAGLAHLVEHLLHRGVVGEEQVSWDARLDAWGGVANAYTTMDDTLYFAEVAARHLGPLLTLEAQRFREPAFTPDDLSGARKVVLEELALRRDLSPWHRARPELLFALAPEHPYRRHPGGSAETLADIAFDDAQGWVDAWVRPDHLHLAVVGPIDPQAVWAHVDGLYGDWTPSGQARPALVPVAEAWGDATDQEVPDTHEPHDRVVVVLPLPEQRLCADTDAPQACAKDAATVALLLTVLADHGSGQLSSGIFERRNEAAEDQTLDEAAAQEAGEIPVGARISTRHLLAGGFLMLGINQRGDQSAGQAKRELRAGLGALVDEAWITPEMLTAGRRRMALDALQTSWSPGARAMGLVRDGARGPLGVSEQLQASSDVTVEDLETALADLLDPDRRRHALLAP